MTATSPDPSVASGRGACHALLASTLALTLLRPGVAHAFDRLLDHVEADGRHIIVQFTCQMAYISHFPLRTGVEVRVELQPLPGCALGGGYSETLPVSTTAAGGVKELRLETGVGARRALVVSFNNNADYLVRPLPGLTGIEIVLAVRSGSVSVEGARAPTAPSRAATRALPPQADLDQLEKDAMAAMRAAITGGVFAAFAAEFRRDYFGGT